MTSAPIKILRSLLLLLGRERICRLMQRTAGLIGEDLTVIGYRKIGILNYQNADVSGERFVIENILTQLEESNRTFFDVGANVGEYSQLLRSVFASAQIYALEPNRRCFEELVRNTHPLGVQCFNLGCGEKNERVLMHSPAADEVSTFSSLHKECLQSIHEIENVVSEEIQLVSLDDFCAEHKIDRLGFLKIDTEGHELAVLQGAQKLLDQGAITLIQFEFNEMNVFSRVFLRDFYDLLTGYDIYRLGPRRLIDIREYKPSNEIFKFQNILAVHKNAGLKVPVT